MISTSDLVAKIEAQSPRVSVTRGPLGDGAEERLVVEGDIGLTPAQVLPYAARRIEIARALEDDPDAEKQGLLGIERDGKLLRWRRGMTLTYCVWRPSFGSDDEHAAAVKGMRAATSDWSAICGVEFEHVAQHDHAAALSDDVSFPVVRQAGGGTLIAMAFFPDDPPPQRFVSVFDGFFSSQPNAFDPIGVMRHELGHVLGFRHEHIRPEAPDLFDPESLDHTMAITDYDPTSVMHYVAAGVGDPKLRFTERDKAGARLVYGGPDSEFTFAD
ncbi:hypothetical protein [Microbacterium sp. NPDC056569]|uniref:hypothetical protein n=1 Tax=Microbacterium sp. NPDC056569 TaxID=3345867 RepID=UPI0036732CA7